MPQGELDLGKVPRRDPRLRDERLPPHIIIKQIQRLIDHLLLLHHILPHPQTLAHPHKLRPPTHPGIIQHRLQILQTRLDLPKSIGALIRVRVDGEDRRAHGLGDFADLGEEDVPVGEDDEDVLARFVARGGVDEGLGDVGVVHVEVPAEDAPEHALEGGDAAALDRACDEPKEEGLGLLIHNEMEGRDTL